MTTLDLTNHDTDGLVFAAFSDGTQLVDYVASGATVPSTAVTFALDGTREIAAFAGAGYANTGAQSFGGVDLFADADATFTVLVCGKQNAINSTGSLISKASATAGTRTFQIFWSSGALSVYLRGTPSQIGIAGVYNDTNYHQHNLIWNGTQAAYSIDGNASTINPDVGSAAQEAENLMLGARTASAPGAQLTGKIEYVLIYNRVLDQATRARIYADSQALLTSGADTTAPILTSPTASATGATTATGGVTTDSADGTLYYLVSSNATETAITVKAGSTQAISSTGAKTVSLTGLTASTSYYLHFCHRDAAGNDSTVSSGAQFTTSASDTTPPTLTGPTGTATGSTTASGTVSTNDSTGTLYYRATTTATETVATVKSGSSQAVSATGTQSVSISGLSASTGYYLHFVHTDPVANDSTVSSTTVFTTSAVATKGAAITLYNGATAQASVTGVTALWWDATAPSGAPVYSTATATTDAAGLMELNIDSVTSLTIGGTGFLLLYKLDGADHRNSLMFAGQVVVSDIS